MERVDVPENDDLVGGPVVFPAPKNEQMGADGGARVSVAVGRQLPEKLDVFPGKGLGVQRHQVGVIGLDGLLLVADARDVGPAAEHDQVAARNAQRVSEARDRRFPGNADSNPDHFV